MKYIDADKLIAGVKYLQDKFPVITYEALFHLITSLQQEQPNKYETALEKAREWMPNVNQGGHATLIDIFPELGEGLDPRYGGRKQEQPEVDLEKEMKESEQGWYNEAAEFWYKHCELNKTKDQRILILDAPTFTELVHDFYELGLNAREESTKKMMK